VALSSSSAARNRPCWREGLRLARAAGRRGRALTPGRAHLQVGHGGVADGRHRNMAHFLLRVRQPVHQRIQHLWPWRARTCRPTQRARRRSSSECSSRYATPVLWPLVHIQAVMYDNDLSCEKQELAGADGKAGQGARPRTRGRARAALQQGGGEPEHRLPHLSLRAQRTRRLALRHHDTDSAGTASCTLAPPLTL